MKKLMATALFAGAALAGTSFAEAADMPSYQQPMAYQQQDASGGVRIGFLDCGIGGGIGYLLGSSKELDCTFNATNGEVDHYTGFVRKLGIDLGFTTQGRLIWAVFAPTAGYHHGSLGGLYKGLSAEATAGIGLGANVLVGGTAGSVQLQTVSVQGQIGLNVAAAGTSVTLNAVN